jgi:hypothetical protein
MAKARRHWIYFDKHIRKVFTQTLQIFTFVGLMNAFANVLALEEGRSIHQQII